MAGTAAAMAVKWALDKLKSLLPAVAAPVASSSSAAEEDLELLRRLERTVRRIHATLVDAEEHWNIREESAKLRLREREELAYGAEDVVEEYEYEVILRRLEVQPPERSASATNSTKRKRHQGNSATDHSVHPVRK